MEVPNYCYFTGRMNEAYMTKNGAFYVVIVSFEPNVFVMATDSLDFA